MASATKAHRSNKLIRFVAIAAALATVASCNSQRNIVAKIGDRTITRTEFEEQWAKTTVMPGTNADSLRDALYESLIHKELLVLAADKHGYFDARVDSIATRFGEDLLRSKVRLDESHIDSTVTEEQIAEAFARSHNEMRMRHIIHWAESSLDSARQRIDGGEPFAQVAADVSLDQRSAADGGLLPWLTDRQLIRQFRETLDPVTIGKVVGPFESPYGWHLAVVDSIREREGADLDAEREGIQADILAERQLERRTAAQQEYRRKYDYKIDTDAAMATLAEAGAAFEKSEADSVLRNAPLHERWIPSAPDRELAGYKGGKITVADYEDALEAGGIQFLARRLSPQGILNDLNEIFYQEARLREARARGYDKDPEWKERGALKREELAVDRLYSEDVMKGVAFSEADLKAYYDEHPDQFQQPEVFRYSFIQVDDASVAQWLVGEMKPISRLAFNQEVTIDERREASALFDSLEVEVGNTGHLLRAVRDSGRREASTAGAVAEAARTMKPGDIGHVVEAYGAHTVFILISHEPKGTLPYEKARERVERTMINAESESRLKTLLEDLEAEFGVERYPERLGPSAGAGEAPSGE